MHTASIHVHLHEMYDCIHSISSLLYRTHRNLHSHTEKAPMTKSHYQVTGYGQVGGICLFYYPDINNIK